MSEIIVDILQKFLGEPKKHSHSKQQVAFDCPECSEQKGMPEGDGKGNLEVNYNKKVFKCWACSNINNTHGSLFKLIKRYGTSQDLKEYKDIIDDYEKIISFGEEDNETRLQPKIISSLPEEFESLSDFEFNTTEYNKALSY